MNGKKLLTVQDLSCVGQCSLTVALPILSHYGIETAVLPTAVLSNHTKFKTWSYLDLTDEIENIYASWRQNDIKFSAFLLGYLGKASIMQLCEKAFYEFSEEDAKVIIDPVMGDDGKLYSGFDEDYVAAMRKLIARADIILPNLTEACYLAGVEYREDNDAAFVKMVLEKLSKLTDATIIVTGLECEDQIGEVIYSEGVGKCIMLPRVPKKSHGTGDIFAAVFTSHYLTGKNLETSCILAGQFVAESLKATPHDHDYGVCFETVLNGEKKWGM
jgi:pyridoxine kinase